uniref:Uncharacterized protein n=1 Tax=Nelumbo nucifera TaxID=4432 RepID=A0A822XAR5_NELNU|nr:TPA_asm: hypothetical protein HUJ06_019977 [Nelumbo nucifera]
MEGEFYRERMSNPRGFVRRRTTAVFLGSDEEGDGQCRQCLRIDPAEAGEEEEEERRGRRKGGGKRIRRKEIENQESERGRAEKKRATAAASAVRE